MKTDGHVRPDEKAEQQMRREKNLTTMWVNNDGQHTLFM